MKIKLLLLITMAISPFCAMAGEAISNAIPVLEQHKACVSNKECTLIQLHCGDCDCGVPVNIKFRDIYIEEKKNRCANYKGGICDLICPTTQSVCRNNKCTAK